jgi:hypothetical protein
VATGAADIPLKLPAPDLGTDAQPEPKSVVVADPEAGMAEAIDDEPDGIAGDDALADDEDDADVPFEPLLQAAVPTASAAAATGMARMRVFMRSPLFRFFLSSSGASRDDPRAAAIR